MVNLLYNAQIYDNILASLETKLKNVISDLKPEIERLKNTSIEGEESFSKLQKIEKLVKEEKPQKKSKKLKQGKLTDFFKK